MRCFGGLCGCVVMKIVVLCEAAGLLVGGCGAVFGSGFWLVGRLGFELV